MASSILSVENQVLGNLTLPAVPVGEQPVLVIVEFLARFAGELEVWTLDDSIDGARFLTETAVDTFVHVDVVAGGASRAVLLPRSSFDYDALRGTDRLAEFARNATALLRWDSVSEHVRRESAG